MYFPLLWRGLPWGEEKNHSLQIKTNIMQVISINQYASGLSRLAAFFIDYFLISAVLSIVFWHWWSGPYIWSSSLASFHFHLSAYYLYHQALVLLYYAFMESSTYQATLGKIVLGIKVVDQYNQRISLSRSLLRNLSKYLSYFILCIGYIMIIFDDRKQGLHDKIADTFIIKA